jgi:transcription initiation factor TFIID TATA-box-binding protein
MPRCIMASPGHLTVVSLSLSLPLFCSALLCRPGTCELGRPIPLEVVAVCLKARLGARIFPALVSRCRETGTAISVFSTGKVVIVGCKSEDAGLLSAHLLVHVLWEECGLNTSVINFHVRNMVYRIHLPYALNLDLVYADAKDPVCPNIPNIIRDNGKGEGGASYEPETFPGIALPVDCGGPVTLALFPSGAGVATGAKVAGQRHLINAMLYDFLRYEYGNEYRELAPHELQARG